MESHKKEISGDKFEANMIVKYVLQRVNSRDRIVINSNNVSYTCGRGKENQIICPSMLVSRHHCIFIIRPDGLYIRDLESSNGVFVNGCQKLSDTLLSENDKIGIGVPELDPKENNYFVYSLLIRQVDGPDNQDNDADDTEVKVKVEPEECPVENQNAIKDPGRKRPNADQFSNQAKRRKTANVREHGEDPVPSTSSANFNSTLRRTIKSESESGILITNVVTLANEVNSSIADNLQTGTSKESVNNEKSKKVAKSHITHIKKISREEAIDVNSLLKNTEINAQFNSNASLQKSKNCDNLVLPSTSRDERIPSIKVEDTEEDLEIVEVIDNDVNKLPNVPVNGFQTPSTSNLVKLKTVKKELTNNYTDSDIICLSSDEENDDHYIFPCSQLFNEVPVIKNEQIQGEKNEIETSENANVIEISDSEDDDDNPWFHKLYNSQVYRPSQEFPVKDEPAEDIVDLAPVDQVGNVNSTKESESLYSKYAKNDQSLRRREIPVDEEQDEDVWDGTKQSQQTSSQEASSKKFIPERAEKSLSEQELSDDQFEEVEADIMNVIKMSSSNITKRRDNEKDKQRYFKNDHERRKTIDRDRPRHSDEERRRSSDQKRKKTTDQSNSNSINLDSISRWKYSEEAKKKLSDQEKRKSIDQERFSDEKRRKQERRKTIDGESSRFSEEEQRSNNQERWKVVDQESSRHSEEERRRQNDSEKGKSKRWECFDYREKKKKSWEDELMKIQEKVSATKPAVKQPARKSIVIEAPHMTKSEKRGVNLKVLRKEETSKETPEKKDESDDEDPSPRRRSRSRSRSISRKSQETFQESLPNLKEIRKEKLKELSAKRSHDTNSNTVPVRKSKGIAKITQKSRQDALLYEQQQAAPTVPGIAHQRKSISPVAHCSKFVPESTRIPLHKDSLKRSDEKSRRSEVPIKDKKDEKPDQEERSNTVDLITNHIITKSIEKANGKNWESPKLADITNNINNRCRKSCLQLNKSQVKKRVSFAKTNEIHEFTIDVNNSLKRIVGKDAPIIRGPRSKPQVESQMFDEYLSRIFEWNPNWVEEQKNLSHEPPVYKSDPLYKVKTNFSSYMEYTNVFRPLLLLEIWNTLSREIECAERKIKFQNRYCSVVANSITRNKIATGEFQTNLLVEMVLTKEDFDKELYPGPGHLIVFEYPFYNERNNKLQFQMVFAYIKTKSHTEIKPATRFNKELMKFTKEASILVTLFVITKKAIEPAADRISRLTGAMYLKSHMRDILALQNLQTSRLRSLILTPKLEDYTIPEAMVTSLVTKDDLNERQMEAVMKISEAVLFEKPQICLIHGPPGTGKSKVIVNIVAQILEHNPNAQMLLCAPSNAAVDELVLRLSHIRTHLGFKNIKMVRVGRIEAMNPKVKNVSLTELGRKQVEKDFALNSSEQNAVKKNELELKRYETLLELTENRIEEIKRNGVKGDLNHLYRQRKELQNYIKTLKTNVEQRVDLASLNRFEKNKVHRETEELVLSKARVIACTLSSCYSGMMEKIFGGKDKIQIPICIVDEASQCCEPENLIPLMLGVKKLILVGDTNQLPATVLSKKAKEMGLAQSLFARLQKTFVNENDNPVIMLNVQYRMDYPILSFPNKYFYGNKLIDRATIKQVPYCSYRVLNLNSLEDDIKFSNTREAEFVSKIVYIMVTSVDTNLFKEALTIGVITPYQNQRNIVQKKIETELKLVTLNRRSKFLIEVNTVDSFQGQEKDVIVMSCVRTDGIGFMADKQRLCVALTRAKSSLILCGNFKTFQEYEMWNELITDAKSRGIFIDVNVNASQREIKNHIMR